MSRTRVELQAAYVLARRPYRDTSLLIDIFTPDHGRVGLVARGVRGGRGARAALLQPLQPLLLSWTEAGELGTLTAAESQGPALTLCGEAIFCAWYLNELLTQLLPRHDAHPDLYADYVAALVQLVTSPPEPLLRRFEMSLLAELGYGLNLDEVEPGNRYVFDADDGPFLASAEAADSYTGDSLIALREGRLERPEDLRAARRLLRAALRRQLNGRELQTPRLLRQLRRQRRGDESED